LGSEGAVVPAGCAKIGYALEARGARARLDSTDLRRRTQQLPRNVFDRAARLLAQVAELAGQLPTAENWASITDHVYAPAYLDVTMQLRTARARRGSCHRVSYLWQVPRVLDWRNERLPVRGLEVKRHATSVIGHSMPPKGKESLARLWRV
jgi:hypothetical protein